MVSLQADTIHDAGEGQEWKASALDNDDLRATGRVSSELCPRHFCTDVTAVLLIDGEGRINPLIVDADGLPL